MGLLPTEICIQILQMLPTSEIGVQTLMRCGMTGRCTLRDASMDPSMWKRYYLCRFIHSEPGKEKERQERFAGDWRLMYLERRRLDSKVIKQLQLVEAADTYSRIALAREIVNLGRDIWDVLSIEAELPPPILFQTEEDIAKVMNGSPLTNLARKFWASELLRLISSGDAAQLWTELYVTSTLGRNHYLECVMSKAMDPFTFEDVFAHLSSFHGVLADDIKKKLDYQAAQCKIHLESIGVVYHPEEDEFNAPRLFEEICTYMLSQGFGKHEGSIVLTSEATVTTMYRISLPHLFMETNRRCLPISLVFVFAGICKRLGLKALPVDTPTTVTVAFCGLHVDVYNSRILGPWDNDAYFSAWNEAIISMNMVRRAANNMSLAVADIRLLHMYHRLTAQEQHELDWTEIMFLTIGMMRDRNFSNLVNSILDFESARFPLMLDLVIREKFIPKIPVGGISERRDTRVFITPEASDAFSGERTFFVGQLVQIRNDAHVFLIIGDEVKQGSLYHRVLNYRLCLFLTVNVDEMTPLEHCTREDLSAYRKIPHIGSYFEDAEFIPFSPTSESGRGRFIPNASVRKIYPRDDERGRAWLQEIQSSD